MINQVPATVSVIIKGGMVADTFANCGGVQVRIYDYDALAVEGDTGAVQVYDAEVEHFTPLPTTIIEVGAGVPADAQSIAKPSPTVPVEASLIFVGMVKQLEKHHRYLTCSTVITYSEFVLGLNNLSMILAVTADALIDRERYAQEHRFSFAEQFCTCMAGIQTPFIGAICFGKFTTMDWLMLLETGTVPDWFNDAVAQWLDSEAIARK